jgi:uncharacterized phage protein (TIGR02218 family)
MWSESQADKYTNGKIVFASGPNAGIAATIRHSTAASLLLSYPLPAPPNAGDEFTASFGCDKTMATCIARFNNIAHFLGFPYVPPPESAL